MKESTIKENNFMNTDLTLYKIYVCALKYINSRMSELLEQQMFATTEQEKQHAEEWLLIYEDWEDQIRELASMEKMCTD